MKSVSVGIATVNDSQPHTTCLYFSARVDNLCEILFEWTLRVKRGPKTNLAAEHLLLSGLCMTYSILMGEI